MWCRVNVSSSRVQPVSWPGAGSQLRLANRLIVVAHERQNPQGIQNIILLESSFEQVLHRVITTLSAPSQAQRHLNPTYTTSGVHWIPVPWPFFLSCNNRLNSVERTSKTHRSVSWSTKDQSKSNTTSCLPMLYVCTTEHSWVDDPTKGGGDFLIPSTTFVDVADWFPLWQRHSIQRLFSTGDNGRVGGDGDCLKDDLRVSLMT